MKSIMSVVSAVVLSVLFGQSLAFAQLVIDKGKVNLLIHPGEKITETLHVKNSGDSDLTVKVYMEDFSYIDPFEGTKEFGPAGSKERSNANWITIAPREITLGPKAEKDVSYVISVPNDVKGGYHGVMIFENLPAKITTNPLLAEEKKIAQAGMSFILRIGTLIFLQTEDTDLKPIVDGFAFDGSNLKFSYKNEGEAILITETKYYTMDQDGNVVDRGDAKKKYLPCGQTTSLNIPMVETLAPGKYTLVVSLDFGGNDVLVREVDFEKSAESVFSVTEVRE